MPIYVRFRGLQNLTNSKIIEGGRPCKVCGGGLDEEETEDY